MKGKKLLKALLEFEHELEMFHNRIDSFKAYAKVCDNLETKVRTAYPKSRMWLTGDWEAVNNSEHIPLLKEFVRRYIAVVQFEMKLEDVNNKTGGQK